MRGEPSRVVRLKAGGIELPPAYEDVSVFSLPETKTVQGAA